LGASLPRGKDRAIRSNLFCPQAGKKGFPLYPLRGSFYGKYNYGPVNTKSSG
jgi:hypothetical protein